MILLDEIDKKILALLAKKAVHSSELSRVLLLPRTTISFRLNRMKKFHKVSNEKAGKKTLWRIPRERIHNKALYAIFREQDFLECYKIIETLPEESTVYAVQGKGAANVIFSRIPEDLLKEIHRTIKRKRIITRGIANKDITQAVTSLNDTLKKSHTGRMQSIKLIDSKFLSNGELFVTPLYVSIVNPNMRIGIIIKDMDVVKLMYDFATLFFNLSNNLETFDLNRFIEKSIEN